MGNNFLEFEILFFYERLIFLNFIRLLCINFLKYKIFIFRINLFFGNYTEPNFL